MAEEEGAGHGEGSHVQAGREVGCPPTHRLGESERRPGD